jgi:hypothetical protein
MTDFAAYIPVVNRFDLLENAIANCIDLHEDLTIIDNSPGSGGIVKDDPSEIKIFRPPVPFTFAQSMNWMLHDARDRGKAFCVYMHSDSLVPPGACLALLDYGRQIVASGRSWGLLWTFYDIMAAYNPQMLDVIGEWDTNFPDYFGDNDWTHRINLASYECINTGIKVGHVGSQTINSDPLLKHITSIKFPLYRQYYEQKWGGIPGKETFVSPFDMDWSKLALKE